MNRKTLFAALACALLVFSMLGCGATNHLQSVVLTPASSASGGLFNVYGIGGTLQLVATANYSNGKQVVLHGQEVTYSIAVDPDNNQTAFGGTLLPPQSNTITLSNTGLLTAIEPAECTWVDVAGIIPPATTAPPPSWALSGDYVVTATYQGVTSQPVFIGIASSVGNPNNSNLPGSEGDNNNPDALCGPQPAS